jgi:hypothetical protein
MSIKINRAQKLAAIGRCPGSFIAMLEAIPASAIETLNSRELAELIDANWRLAGASKAIAASDALSEGGVWDHRNQRFRELRAAH